MKYTVRLFKNTTVRLYNVLFSKCTANFVTFWFIFCDGLGYFFRLKVHSLSQRADIFYFSCMMGILLSLVPRLCEFFAEQLTVLYSFWTEPMNQTENITIITHVQNTYSCGLLNRIGRLRNALFCFCVF